MDLHILSSEKSHPVSATRAQSIQEESPLGLEGYQRLWCSLGKGDGGTGRATTRPHCQQTPRVTSRARDRDRHKKRAPVSISAYSSTSTESGINSLPDKLSLKWVCISLSVSPPRRPQTFRICEKNLLTPVSQMRFRVAPPVPRAGGVWTLVSPSRTPVKATTQHKVF